jgi:tetratricopeptide (TPR) repeat protein
MKVLSFVFLFIFAWNVNAQTPTVDKLFEDGTAYANAAQFDSALKSYKTALAAAERTYAGKESRARLHYNIGLCYFRLERFGPAADEFKRAMLLKPDYAAAYFALDQAKTRFRGRENLNAQVLQSPAGN